MLTKGYLWASPIDIAKSNATNKKIFKEWQLS